MLSYPFAKTRLREGEPHSHPSVGRGKAGLGPQQLLASLQSPGLSVAPRTGDIHITCFISDQWKMGQFLQSWASPDKCAFQILLHRYTPTGGPFSKAVWLAGVVAWPQPHSALLTWQSQARLPLLGLVPVHRWEHRRASRARLVTLPRAVSSKH